MNSSDNISIIAIIVLYNADKQKVFNTINLLNLQLQGVICVDNSDKKTEDLPYPSHTFIIDNPHNLGVAKAQNQGIIKAIELGATYILLLDQDSLPLGAMISSLLKGFKQPGNIGAVGPTLINSYTGVKENYGLLINGIKIEKKKLIDEYNNVSYIISSGCLISVECLKEVGLMKEEMFIDGVDFEWCLRARYHGFHILQARDAFLLHELGNGIKDRVLNHSPHREYYILKNSLSLIFLKHIPFGYKIRRVFMSITRMVSNIRWSRKDYLKNDLKAIVDLFKEKI